MRPFAATPPPRRPMLWQRALACVLMLTLQVSSFAQAVGPMGPLLRGVGGVAGSGYRADGTLVLGGQVVHGGGAGVHQNLHDILNPTLWSTAAVALSNTTEPSFVQGTLQEMEDAIAVSPEDGGQALSRLYLTPHNPYSLGSPEADAAEMLANPEGNLARYQQSLEQALLLQDGWRATVPSAEGSGQVYLGKTHESSSAGIFNRGFDNYPDKPVFQAAQDPAGGATAFLALQGAQARRHLQHLQSHNAALLGGTVFFSQQTLRAPSGAQANNPQAWAEFDAALGSAYARTDQGWGATTGFTLGYLDPSANAHTFDIQRDPHFRNLHSQQREAMVFGSEGQGNTNALLGAALRQGAVQHQLGQQAAAQLDLSQFKDDQALFFQGFNLFGVGNLTDRAEQELLERLSTGQIAPGHPDYERARALAEERFRLGYAQLVEYERPQVFNEFGARWQAQSQNLTGVSDAELFEQGFNLYDGRADARQEQLLRDLQSGQLKAGMAGYEEARALAEARYRVALEQALTPPKNDPWKQVVAVVVAAVVVYFTAGAASGWAASAIPGATTTVTATSVVGGVTVTTTSTVIATSTVAGAAATAIGSAVAAYAGAVVSAGIQTGSLSQALKAGENTLKGGVAGILVNMALTSVGLDAGAISAGLDVSQQTGQSIYNGLASALTNTLATGGDLGQNLLTGAINTGVEVVGQQAAGWIGANTDLGSFEKYAAHALLGCGAGMARSGSGDGCAPAAAGAVVGHLSADSVKVALSNDQDPGLLASIFSAVPGKTLNDNVAFISGLIGGGAAALVGDNSQIQGNFALGQGAAENAAKNNYLKFDERKMLEQSERDCYTGGNSAACATVTALRQKDELSDKLLAHAAATCKGADCAEVANFTRQEMAALGCPSPTACPDQKTLSAYWVAAQSKAQGLEASTPELWLLDGKAVLDLGKLGIRALATSGTGSLEALGALSRTSADDLIRGSDAKGVLNSHLTRDELISSLPAGTKISPENVVDIRRLPNGRTVWLETGNDSAGLRHIYKQHEIDFINKGILHNEIPTVVMNALEYGRIIGTNGSANVYRIMHNGVEQNVAVGVGSNGFVVRANPVSSWRPLP